MAVYALLETPCRPITVFATELTRMSEYLRAPLCFRFASNNSLQFLCLHTQPQQPSCSATIAGVRVCMLRTDTTLFRSIKGLCDVTHGGRVM
eukprot:3178574-Amphidinium_carterae.1